jgi:hypothetical protein
MKDATNERFVQIAEDLILLEQEGACPNEFLCVTVTKIKKWAKTKKAVTKAFQKRLNEILPVLEKDLNCAQYNCEDGDCEFDYLVEDETPRKIFQKTGKGKKRRRWVIETDVYFGCFCSNQGDDPENDPGNGNF